MMQKLLVKKLVLIICTIGLYGVAMAQSVTGRVTDQNNVPLPGASVQIKKTLKGVTTNNNGEFSIAASNGTVLVISSVGYKTQEVTVRGSSVVVKLEQSTDNVLPDVVVVGYGTVKRKDLTGSVGSVNMKDFQKAPIKSFDEGLAGRVAGVAVQSSDGQPGRVANIVIRGAGSITQSQAPLYVIDGFPTEASNANSISPSDIESIDILKDASATAIYGARGANGVIIITTKKGKSGPPQVTYNAYYGWQKMPQKVKLMDAYEFVRYVKDLNPIIADSVYLANGKTVDDYRNAPSIDMQDYVFRTGVFQNHDIAVRGGNDKTRYSLSGNYNDISGTIINSGFKRYQGRFVLDQMVNNKLKVGINTNYAFSEASGVPISSSSFYSSANALYGVWGWRPTTSIAWKDSAVDLLNSFYDPTSDNIAFNQDYRVNPYINLQNQYTRNKINTFTSNAYAEYNFTPKLKLRVQGGITNVQTTAEVFNNSFTQSGSKWTNPFIGANGSISNTTSPSWINENTLTYTTRFGKSHNFSVLGDFSAQKNKTSFRSFSATQLPNEDLGLDGLDLAPVGFTSSSSSSSVNTLVSWLGRINYNYKSTYFITASFRADGSSKFPIKNRWGYFPSVAASWRFKSEAFMKNLSFISDAKLRLGYGYSGNNRVSDFAYLPTIDLTNVGYYYSTNQETPSLGSVISTAGNSNLKWETSKQGNIGLDISFLENRISLTIDVYKRVVEDLLLNAPLPGTNGIPSGTGFKNVGKLQNKGLEIALNTDNLQNSNFKWNSSFNISFNDNKILSLAENQFAILSGAGTFFNTTFSSLSPYISVIGRPLGEMYGLIFDGVYQYPDFDLMPNGTYLLKANLPLNGSTRINIQPGDIKYKDLNNDGVIDVKDYTIIGSGLPKFTGGFSNNFSYKNFDLNVLLQWSVGNDVINANRYIFEGNTQVNPSLNQYASYANRWTPANPSNKLYRAGGMINAAYSSRVIEDGSYLKLRTVSLGYNLPSRMLKRAGINSLRIYASAQNLYTWTKYSGLDPEASSRQSNLTPGFDYSAYPHSLSVVFGVNLNF